MVASTTKKNRTIKKTLFIHEETWKHFNTFHLIPHNLSSVTLFRNYDVNSRANNQILPPIARLPLRHLLRLVLHHQLHLDHREAMSMSAAGTGPASPASLGTLASGTRCRYRMRVLSVRPLAVYSMAMRPISAGFRRAVHSSSHVVEERRGRRQHVHLVAGRPHRPCVVHCGTADFGSDAVGRCFHARIPVLRHDPPLAVVRPSQQRPTRRRRCAVRRATPFCILFAIHNRQLKNGQTNGDHKTTKTNL